MLRQKKSQFPNISVISSIISSTVTVGDGLTEGEIMITDLTPYRKHIDQFDLTEQQKLDFVNAWVTIINNIFDHHLHGAPLIFDKERSKLDHSVAESNS